MTETIYKILQYIYINRKVLSKNKFNHVHDIGDYYSIHKSNFVPLVMLDNEPINFIIEELMELEEFKGKMTFESDTLWLRIEK